MLSAGETNRGALIRGVDPAREATVADIGTHMRAGALTDLKPGEFGIVLGAELARALGVRMGDPVVVITPQGTMTPAGTLPRLKTFRVVGVFEVGMFEFDSGLALIDLDDAKKLYRQDGVSGVRLKLDDMFAAPAVARELARTLTDQRRDPRLDAQPREFLSRGADRKARDVHHPDADHRRRGVQHRVGAGDDGHRQAGRHRDPAHTGRGAVVDHGDLHDPGRAHRPHRDADRRGPGALLLALNVGTVLPAVERLFNVQFLDKTVYYISELPSDLQRADVFTIAAIALVLALVATIYPAWRAAKVNPAEALRYE